MLTVHCPTCNSALGLGEEMVGQQVRCGGCQEVFLVEAPPPPRRSRRDEEEDFDDRPRRRPARREDDDRDRPSRRRSRRDESDDDEDEYDDEPRPRKKRKKKKKKAVQGQPGLSVAAAILFLVWGGLGAIYTIYSVIGLVWALDAGAPFTFILGAFVGVILRGVFCGYLISSGLTILNGQAESIASIGIAVLVICVVVLVLSVGAVAAFAPRFVVEAALILLVWVTVALSGVIVGGIFCLVCSEKYEKWQAS